VRPYHGPVLVLLALAFVYEGRKVLRSSMEETERDPVEMENDRFADRASDTSGSLGVWIARACARGPVMDRSSVKSASGRASNRI